MADLSNIELLLETLSSNLSPESAQVLNSNNHYKQSSLEFLNELLNQGSNPEILLSTNLKPSLGDNEAGHTLIEQVAELESTQRLLESKIQKTVYSNLELPLETNRVYNECLNLFKNDFNQYCQFLSTNFSKNDDDDNNNNNVIDDGNGEVEEDESTYDKKSNKTQESSWKDLLKQQHLYANTNNNNNSHNTNDQFMDPSQSSSIILRNMDGIMDILELPSLANACVKNGYYAECVEIASHVRRLSIRYSDISIIKKVEYGIQLEIKEMVNGLIRLLNTDLKQGSIMKIITYLKRIGPFQNSFEINDQSLNSSNSNSNNHNKGSELINNELLQKIFFKSRYQFILNELEILSPLKNSNSIDRYLKRCVEVIREHCFQTIMSFESIFPNDHDKKTNSLLFSFIKSLILRLCSILKENFDKVGKISKDGLLLQLIYCSQSLVRIGGDFNLIILEELKDVIDKKNWCMILKKQKELIKSLNRNMNELNLSRRSGELSRNSSISETVV
ncbi:hypothetical protein CANARDRAFT_22341 [[Candida] arabinofermentans NRRL YB-2248]|uniref:Conserved oligomeric Golgi complex subunit 8 n=1 Tax=[Candida] arabinofermentans NRRL YB-2248 TaxID=983967 RepID=A0A1E4T3W9_9ASCO|nr:hypothetical protein CANARDRAFT_22341 [[Candida] arabinofermentans NRRL YB-2248]